MSPALAGGFLTSASPGKSITTNLNCRSVEAFINYNSGILLFYTVHSIFHTVILLLLLNKDTRMGIRCLSKANTGTYISPKIQKYSFLEPCLILQLLLGDSEQ